MKTINQAEEDFLTEFVTAGDDPAKKAAALKSFSDFARSIEVQMCKFKFALQEIARYDEQPIWNDDRDDAADGMLELARKALDQ